MKKKTKTKKQATKRAPKKKTRATKTSPARATRTRKLPATPASLLRENAELRMRLNEAEETLNAIRKGEVDALIVASPEGEQVFALKGAERPYRILVESINEGALTLTEDGSIINCNKAFSNIVDMPSGMLIGTMFRDLVAKKDRDLFETFWVHGCEFEAKAEFELHLGIRKVPVFASLSARIHEQVCWLFMVVTDITERKRAEAELAEYSQHLERLVDEKTHDLHVINEELQTVNEELLTSNEELIETNDELGARKAEIEALFNAISDAIIYTDKKSRVLLVNPTAEQVFGYSKEELLGKTTAFLYANPGDFKRIEKNRLTLDKNEIQQPLYEVRHRRKNGSEFIANTRDALVMNTKGVVIGFISIHRDITEQKQAEAAVLKLSEEIAAHNLELEFANKELEAFTYSVSHDLRAPLRHMMGFSDAMVQEYADTLDTQGQDFLLRIHRGAERMNMLITDLLKLSKVSRQEISRSQVDLSAIVSSVVAELRQASPARNAEVTIRESVTALADHNLMKIVLTNLLGNAWKFTAKTQNARIEFGAFEYGRPNEECGMKNTSAVNPGETVYYVRDNGAGFDPTYASKMFLPFHRLHAESEFEGTGIGLTIVERVIRRHNGTVWAEGEIDKGAAIFFTLG